MDVYRALQELLDKDAAGCPPAPEIDEILRILFSEKEARVALGLGFRPIPLDLIAERAGVGRAEARRHLDALAARCLVFVKEKGGESYYALQPVMPGLYEFPFIKAQDSDMLERLAPLWNAYMKRFGRGLGSPSMSFARVLPIEEEIEGAPGVLPYEKVYQMIDQARVVGLGHCACRRTMQKCGAPREACMMFDDTCDFLVQRGFGRYISRDEMKEKLREFDRLGLVHQVNNSRDKLSFICNCCPCCCELLQALTRLENPCVLSSSGFVPVLSAGKCTGCGICYEQRCPMGAIRPVDGALSVEERRCIGCGLCVSGCPERALRLSRRQRVPVPAASIREINLTILREKGKLEAFLPLITPPPGPERTEGK
jgi:Na+-translocating ferredoxin:NAD+ oxidoreductase subunit B